MCNIKGVIAFCAKPHKPEQRISNWAIMSESVTFEMVTLSRLKAEMENILGVKYRLTILLPVCLICCKP